jgi:hypothetical protein
MFCEEGVRLIMGSVQVDVIEELYGSTSPSTVCGLSASGGMTAGRSSGFYGSRMGQGSATANSVELTVLHHFQSRR